MERRKKQKKEEEKLQRSAKSQQQSDAKAQQIASQIKNIDVAKPPDSKMVPICKSCDNQQEVIPWSRYWQSDQLKPSIRLFSVIKSEELAKVFSLLLEISVSVNRRF